MKIKSIIFLVALGSSLQANEEVCVQGYLRDTNSAQTTENIRRSNANYLNKITQQKFFASSENAAYDDTPGSNESINAFRAHLLQRKNDTWTLSAKDSTALAQDDKARAPRILNRQTINEWFEKIEKDQPYLYAWSYLFKTNSKISPEQNMRIMMDKLNEPYKIKKPKYSSWNNVKTSLAIKFQKIPLLPELMGSIYDLFHRKK